MNKYFQVYIKVSNHTSDQKKPLLKNIFARISSENKNNK
jgi:hypothetical protein